jgi:hypothetical protein
MFEDGVKNAELEGALRPLDIAEILLGSALKPDP